MAHYKYLIVGGGMTADAAAQGVREHDLHGTMAIICGEPHLPYNRPPLSKALWKGESEDSIWRETATVNADIILNRTVRKLDATINLVVDDHGDQYTYEKLLLATGGTPRRLPDNPEGVLYFRTLDDYRQLRKLADTGDRFVVIGGGFIGSEIAASLTLNHKKVTMIFPEASIGARAYPPRLSEFLNVYFTSKGIEVLAGQGVASVKKGASGFIVQTEDGREIVADGVIAGLGIIPNVDLARDAGLSVENGIVVDEYCRTSHPDIFSAGDVANFPSHALGKHIRVEHEDNANSMGDIAGRNMAGEVLPYRHIPSFYSDLFELGYEAVGELDAKLEIVELWKTEFREGTIYYMRDGRIRGVLLWNTWGELDAARMLIEGGHTAQPHK